MIDPRMEEQASLHVLGALDEREAREFQAILRQDPELQAFVARLSKVTGALAGSVPSASLPPHLRNRILRQIDAKPKPASAPRPAPGFSLGFWLPWAFAAALIVLCALLFTQTGRLEQVINRQTARITDLNQLAQTLQAATNDLQQTVLALEETNRLASLRIAMLNSQLASAPGAIAVTLWDSRKQEGVFVAQHLGTLPAGRDYQLWVIDPQYKTPVSAGVFQVDGQGGGRVSFKAGKTIQTASKFAVTEEPKGGLPVPSLDHLVLIGG